MNLCSVDVLIGDENMKRVLAFILTIVMVFSLTACAAEDAPQKTEKPKPTHTALYAQEVCSGCDEEDSFHAYEYLVKWVKENGTHTNIGFVSVLSIGNSAIIYDDSKEYLYAYSFSDSDDFSYTLELAMDNYSFQFSVNEDSIIGFASASTFTRTQGNLQIIHSDCVDLTSDECAEFAEVDIAILLEGLVIFLENENLGITVADLGFTSYESESAQS